MIKVTYPYGYMPAVKSYLEDKDIDASFTFFSGKKEKVKLGVKRSDDALTIEVQGSKMAEQATKLYLDSAESVLGGFMEKVNKVVNVSIEADKVKKVTPAKKAAAKKATA